MSLDLRLQFNTYSFIKYLLCPRHCVGTVVKIIDKLHPLPDPKKLVIQQRGGKLFFYFLFL